MKVLPERITILDPYRCAGCGASGPRGAVAAVKPMPVVSAHNADGLRTRPHQRGDGHHRRTNAGTLRAAARAADRFAPAFLFTLSSLHHCQAG
jgi:hypothetical protein